VQAGLFDLNRYYYLALTQDKADLADSTTEAK
jgi:hypothetical protein